MSYVGMSYVHVGMSMNGECLFGLWACPRACLTSARVPSRNGSLDLSPGLDLT